MKKLINTLKTDNIITGYLYFYIHMITEIICFFSLSRIINNSILLWTIPFVYDAFAFVPQSLIGYFSDKKNNINMGIIGIILLTIGFITYSLNLLPGNYTELIILCLGNAFIHVEGAEVTLRTSKGKLSHSAIFVSGGSFGVIIGKLVGKTSIPFWMLLIFILSMIPFILLADRYKKELCNNNYLKYFNYHNDNINDYLIILFAVFVVIVRGYMGYGIPTSWNKTVLQTILLYISMGIGKALGGILSDTFGIRRVALLSVLFSIPLLLFGDNIMLISLVGIILFSMTMSITLGIITSVLKASPGLSFGLTTIGLYLGTLPIFFFKIKTFFGNALLILVCSILCLIIFNKIIKKDGKI